MFQFLLQRTRTDNDNLMGRQLRCIKQGVQALVVPQQSHEQEEPFAMLLAKLIQLGFRHVGVGVPVEANGDDAARFPKRVQDLAAGEIIRRSTNNFPGALQEPFHQG